MTGHGLRMWIAVGLLGATAVAASPTPVPAVAPAVSWDSYRVLSERNIFVRGRSRPARTAVSRPSAAPAPAKSEESYIALFGVARQGDEWIAFFEDSRTRERMRVSAGQSVCNGKVASVTIEGVEYECEGGPRKIVVGQNLAGLSAGLSAALSPAYTTAPASARMTTEPAGASSQPEGVSGEGGGDVLERMRQRRAQELR